MMELMKKYWKWAAGLLVALSAFLLGRKKEETELVDLKEKENNVEKKLSEEEKLQLAKIHKKYVDARIVLRKQHRKETREAEKQVLLRKIELLESAKEDPTKIDKILLEDFNIKELK